MRLFQNSLQTYLQAKLDSEVQRVTGLTLERLTNPALAGSIERFWSNVRPRMPAIHPDRKKGTLRDHTRQIYRTGRYFSETERVIDVRVPFDGDAAMFGYHPSSWKVLNEQVNVERDHITYTMPFDPAQQGRYEQLLAHIEHNLDAMRKEEESFSNQALQRLNKLAADRRVKLEAEVEVAKKFDFPVS